MLKDENVVASMPFPQSLAGENLANLSEDELINLVWSEIILEDIDKNFALPVFSPHFESVSRFVETELKVQLEIWRADIHMKVRRNGQKPKAATNVHKEEKHMHFPCPHGAGDSNELHVSDLSSVYRVPLNGKFTNYVVLLQKVRDDGCGMDDLTLAFTKFVRKRDGALFVLGKDYERLRSVHRGTTIYVRFLKNASMPKTHLRAIAALKQSEQKLKDSYVTQQLLAGRVKADDTKTVQELDQWINSKQDGASTNNLSLQDFNQQQQRALAMETLTTRGVVLIQGPPGTGKSHTIVHGILPQVVGRNEKVLLVCNSNVAVDALMLKCANAKGGGSLKGQMIRCGFKSSVSDEIVQLGLYAEGDALSRAFDRYGKLPGANSNTDDSHVQHQIRSKQVVFTTIHFASKEKGRSTLDEDMYWNFDTLVLDEAAQIEDSRLFIVLARCPTLKKIILVGDPKQIQPYVPDSLRKQKYGQSTMERLMANSPEEAHVMLEEQFRMAPMLRQVVSHLYYDNRLVDGPNVAGRGPRSDLKLKPLLVVNLTGTNMAFSRLHQSYENNAEAAVCEVIYEFLFSSDFLGAMPALEATNIGAKDVCVLTPFNRHKDRLRMTLCDIDEDTLDSYSGQTFGGSGITFGPSSPSKAQALLGTQAAVPDDVAAMVESIDTVDKFQGSERKVVIVSTCVDSKPLRAADPHFINVACSRAQQLLVVVGNFNQGLASNEDWRFVWNTAKESGSYLEHEVTMVNDDEGEFDIHRDSLNSKLRVLLSSAKKRPRGDDGP